MRLFGTKRQDHPEKSVSTAETKSARNTLTSKSQPLLADEDGGTKGIEQVRLALSKRQSHLVENSYSSSEVDSPPSWGEKVGPVQLRDEWGFEADPESREPDPELGAIVPLQGGEFRSASRSADAPRNMIESSQATHQQNMVQLQNAVSSDDEVFARMKEGPLPNPETLVLAQLIQWKFAAEEGSLALRIPAVLGAVGLMVTTLLPYALETGFLTAGHAILSCFVLSHGFLICIIDGRSNYARDPLGSRAKLRNFVTRHLNVLRLVWGRGMLYILVGLVNMAHEAFMCFISGSVMVAIGLIAITSGLRAYQNLLTLRQSLADEEFVWHEFIKHDVDHDGYLNPSEFAQFIWDLGLEFDDLYTLKAFNTIDANHDRKITFRQFMRWWCQVRLNNDTQIS
jgi:hypothetical protein